MRRRYATELPFFLLKVLFFSHSSEGKGEREKHRSIASCTRPIWGSNQQPFGYGTTVQPTEPHWPGLPSPLLITMFLIFSSIPDKLRML